MTTSQTPQGTSNASVAMSKEDVLLLLEASDTMFLAVHGKETQREFRRARSTIESTFAALERVKTDNLLHHTHATHFVERAERAESELAELREVRDRYCEISAELGRERIFSKEVESDRTALLAMVKRLLPYARAFKPTGSVQSEIDVRDAESLLSRIDNEGETK